MQNKINIMLKTKKSFLRHVIHHLNACIKEKNNDVIGEFTGNQ